MATTTFNIEDIKTNYREKTRWREVSKWLFSIVTFGFGGLFLWAKTNIVKEGEIGLRRSASGELVLLPPGRHVAFPWESYPVENQSLANPLINLDPFKIVTVKTGEVAITHDKGKLVVLHEGQHLITDAAHTVKGLLNTQQVTQKLPPITASTRNNVGVTLSADVRYQITDPERALREINDIEKSIIETIEMYLTQDLMHHGLDEFAPAAAGLNYSPESSASQGMSGLISELMRDIKGKLETLGINLLGIGITGFKINDIELARGLGHAAVVNSEARSALTSAETQSQVARIAAEAAASTLRIQADAEANASKIKGNALLEVAEALKGNPDALRMYTMEQYIRLVGGAQRSNLFFGLQPSSSLQTNTLVLESETMRVQ